MIILLRDLDLDDILRTAVRFFFTISWSVGDSCWALVVARFLRGVDGVVVLARPSSWCYFCEVLMVRDA